MTESAKTPSGQQADDWVLRIYDRLEPTLRRAENGLAVEKAHSMLTGAGFSGRDTVRGIARLVGAGYLERTGGRLYLPGEAPG